jgi:mannose-6-phosphate isomerase-like protein (cupin superfamily)
MFKRERLAVAMSILMLGLLGGGCAVQGEEDEAGLEEAYSPPSGVTLSVLARGALDGNSHFVAKWPYKYDDYGEGGCGAAGGGGGMLACSGPEEWPHEHDLVQVEITVAPGGHTGWHYHPGQVYFTIVEGAVTVYHATNPCSGTLRSAGQSFVEQAGEVEIARNFGTTNARVIGNFITDRNGPFRIDAPAPKQCP